jgi:hypothetical protein
MASLVLYGSSIANGTLTTADTMSATTGGAETSKTTTVTGANNYAEVLSQGGTIASVTSIGSPSGKGWVYATGAGTFATGNWSASATFSCSAPGTTDITIRFYRYSSGTYTSIGTINKTGIVAAKTTYSFAATSFSSITFASGDLLYVDVWWHDLNDANDTPIVYVSNSATQGVASDMQVTTSSFAPPNVTKSVGVRTLLRVLATKSVGIRTLLRVLATKSVGARTLLRVLATKSLGIRARLSVLLSKSLGVRTRLRVLSTKSLGVRTRLQAAVTKSVGVRTLLRVLSTKTVGVRLILHSFATKSLGVRTRLSVLLTKSLGVRTLLRVLNTKTLGVRTVLHILGTKTLGVRALLRVLATKSVGIRAHILVVYPTKTLGARVRIAGIASGKFTCWANGTGTASFDHFRCTEYPDPALSLAPVLPRLGSTTVLWDEIIPTNASRTVKTSLDGVNWTDVSSQNGGTIPGLTGQPDPTIDIFNANSSANYTNTSKSGGSAATATYDTTNSRITLSGGSGGLYLYTAISDNDVDLISDMDYSDAGGLVWRYVDTSNYYELGAYDDSASGGFTNQLRLYKVVSGTRSLIGSASTVVWPRSTPGTSPYKRLRVTMLGSTITVYFDGTVMQTATDSAFTSGKMGLRNDGGTSRYYQLRLQQVGDYVTGTPAGDIVTGDFVYTQVTLSTTDPTADPQIQDLTTTANSPSVANGAVIPQLHDPTKPFAAFYNNEMDSLAQSSGDYYWALNSNALTFAERQAVPSPWILHSSDLLFTPRVKPTFSADLYRDRMQITNCLGTVTVTGEEKIADGTASSWQMAYPLYSAPTITVQSVSKTVGVLGVDTGKDFYWQAASNSISQDSGAAKIPSGYVISVNYVGQFFTTVTRDNLTEQAARQAIEGGTGIVEAIEDGKQMLVSAATTYADGLLARNSNNNTVEIQVSTRRAGLQKGQVVPAFLPEHTINNAQLLVTNVVTIGEQLADGTILYQYQVTATNGPNLSRWSTVLGL